MIRNLMIFAVILMTTGSYNIRAQIVLQHSYPASASITRLDKDGYKYYVMDVLNSECRIYNLDHSLWQVINISLPANSYLYDIQYVTQHLFDNDDHVELVVTYYEYVENGGDPYYIYGTKVIKQTGEELLDVPGGGYSAVAELEGSAPKLFVYVYDFSVLPYSVSTNVYNIDTTGSFAVRELSSRLGMTLGEAYPNPSDTYFIIPYKLNKSTDNAVMVVSDPSGRVIRRYDVDQHSGHVKVQRNDLPSGPYMYRLETPFHKTEGKVILFK